MRFVEREAFALRAEDPERASLLFDELLTRWPTRQNSLRAYGRLLMARRAYEKAQQIWLQLRDISPDDTEALLQLARIHTHGRNFTEAMIAAAEVVRLAPDNDEARQICVSSLLQQFMAASKSSGDQLENVLKSAQRIAPWIRENETFYRLTALPSPPASTTPPRSAKPLRTQLKPGARPTSRVSARERDRIMFVISEAARVGEFATLLDGLEQLSRDVDIPGRRSSTIFRGRILTRTPACWT